VCSFLIQPVGGYAFKSFHQINDVTLAFAVAESKTSTTVHIGETGSLPMIKAPANCALIESDIESML